MIKSRKITDTIEKWIDEKEIIILTGARQVGKTSLLQLIEDRIKMKNVSEENIFYLSMEDINILNTLNESPENIFQYVLDKNKKNYFLMDEIQYLDNPSNFLKLLYDKYSGKIKLIVTGSSLELKADFQDSLAGRKVAFEIKPLDFEEFLQFKNFGRIDYLFKKDLPDNIKKEFDDMLEEYLLYGGMPAIVLQDDKEKKIKLLEEYIGAYINKDIRAIGKIENIANFNNFIKTISSQIGGLLNISELSNTLNIDRRTLEKYLDLLKYTFVLYKSSPFSGNIRSQITKMQKIYLFDTGIRNAILENFVAMDSRNDAGALFENFVYMELKKNISDKIFFYRTAGGGEIDFVMESGGIVYPIEAKFKRLRKKIDERVIENFMVKLKKECLAKVVNLSLNDDSGESIKYIDYRFVKNIVK
ncbi:MAG: ATP-binding protein [Patescibacteria group bacterium]